MVPVVVTLMLVEELAASVVVDTCCVVVVATMLFVVSGDVVVDVSIVFAEVFDIFEEFEEELDDGINVPQVPGDSCIALSATKRQTGLPEIRSIIVIPLADGVDVEPTESEPTDSMPIDAVSRFALFAFTVFTYSVVAVRESAMRLVK